MCISLLPHPGNLVEQCLLYFIIVDIMVAAGGIKPPRVTLTRIEYSEKQEEALKH
jgi:hypothetical protein